MKPSEYIRNKAAKLRERAITSTESEQLTGAARQLEIVADELDQDFHIEDEED